MRREGLLSGRVSVGWGNLEDRPLFPMTQGATPHATSSDPRSDTTLFAEHVDKTLFHFSCGSQETIGVAVAF